MKNDDNANARLIDSRDLLDDDDLQLSSGAQPPAKAQRVDPQRSSAIGSYVGRTCGYCHRYAVRKGYKFGEPEIEQEYLTKVLYSKLNIIAIVLVLVLYAIDMIIRISLQSFLLTLDTYGELPFAIRVLYAGSLSTSIAIALLFSGSAILYIVTLVVRLRKDDNFLARCAPHKIGRIATVTAVVGFFMFFARNGWDARFVILQFNYTLQMSLSSSSDIPTDNIMELPVHCGAIHYDGTTGPIDTGGGRNKSSFPSLVAAARDSGLLSTSNTGLYHIASLWVGVKILVINNMLPAREFVVVIVCNAVALFAMVYLMLTESGVDIQSSVTNTFWCIPLVGHLLVSSAFEYFIAIFGSSVALIQQTLFRARLKRELFFWTKKFQVKMEQLEQQADPFRVDRLRQWLGSTEQRIDAATRKRENAAALFWDIPSHQLHLKRKVASGAGGTVWLAKFKGRNVAAKQLFSLASVTDREGGLQELANEVAIMGTLDHASVVRFLGLCRRNSAHNATLTEAFIVQEWCGANLRHVIDARAPAFARTPGASALAGHDREFLARYFHPVSRMLKCAHQLARGMSYLHEMSIIHRDLKPENVLLSVGEHPHVRICDFGISTPRAPNEVSEGPSSTASINSEGSILGLDNSNSFSSGSTSLPSGGVSHSARPLPPGHKNKIGTVEYMPPEVFACFVTHASCDAAMTSPMDVYAFGLILWELLASRANSMHSDSPTASPAGLLRKRIVVREGANIKSPHVPGARGGHGPTRGKGESRFVDSNGPKSGLSRLGVASSRESLQKLAQIRRRRSYQPTGVPVPLETVYTFWELPPMAALPEDTPAGAVSLMQTCLTVQADKRPEFVDISSTLNDVFGIIKMAQNRQAVPNPRQDDQDPLHRSRSPRDSFVEMSREAVSNRHLRGSSVSTASTMLTSSSQANMSRRESESTIGQSRSMSHNVVSQVEPKTSFDGEADLRDDEYGDDFKDLELDVDGNSGVSCWGKMWARCGLYYRSEQLETKFNLSRLRNDDYYRSTKWMLLMLSTLYLFFALTMIYSYQLMSLTKLDWYTVYADSIFPGLMGVLLFICALAGWIKRMRKWISAFIAPYLTVATTLSFVVYPVLEGTSETQWGSTNFSLETINSSMYTAFAPLDSEFAMGDLVGLNNTLGIMSADGQEVCAGWSYTQAARLYDPGNGLPEQNVSNTLAVGACASYYFMFGIGCLKWAHSWGYLLLNSMTLPVLTLFLALPVRLYVITLVIPFVGTLATLVNVYFDDVFYESKLTEAMEANPLLRFDYFANPHSNQSSIQRVIGFGLLVVAIYGSCLVSAATHERYHRSLFTVHLVLREKRSVLLETADLNRYRYILKRNRDRLSER